MADAQVNVLVDQTQAVNSLVDNVPSSNNSSQVADQHVSTELKNLSEEERLKLRVKKFGAQTENLKKDMRAQRFGGASTNGGSDGDALNKRAQRFGTAASSAPNGADKELMEKRAKRFGIDAPESGSQNNSKVPDEVLAKRKERFGEVNEGDDAKKKLRQQRFQNKV